jgi:hypothetical protein
MVQRIRSKEKWEEKNLAALLRDKKKRDISDSGWDAATFGLLEHLAGRCRPVASAVAVMIPTAAVTPRTVAISKAETPTAVVIPTVVVTPTVAANPVAAP